jgi:hypothetical protein
VESVFQNWTLLAWGAAGLALSVAVGTVVLIAIAASLPPKFLQDPDSCFRISASHPMLFWACRIAKNMAGYLAIVVGCVLALPGVPGPGLPIMVLGIVMVDFPGKRRLLQRLLSVPNVVRGLNAIRVRCGMPQLMAAQEATRPDSTVANKNSDQ